MHRSYRSEYVLLAWKPLGLAKNVTFQPVPREVVIPELFGRETEGSGFNNFQGPVCLRQVLCVCCVSMAVLCTAVRPKREERGEKEEDGKEKEGGAISYGYLSILLTNQSSITTISHSYRTEHRRQHTANPRRTRFPSVNKQIT